MVGNSGGRARQRFVPCLGSAAEALLGLNRRWGGRMDAVAAEIERRLDQSALNPGGSRDALIPLLRMRDLQRYVETDADVRALKLALLDAALVRRDPVRRWDAMRAILAREMERVLDVPREELIWAYKREASTPGSRVSRLIRLCALLNLEASGELPPPNVFLRFVRGKFPEHVWEADQDVVAWQPTTPLGRWEYLMVDLADEVIRAQQGAGDAHAEPHWTAADRVAAGSASAVPQPNAGERVYCRWDAKEPLDQLPLLPVDPERWLPDLLRHVQSRLGAEGVRQAALILTLCSSPQPGGHRELDRKALGSACGPATKREHWERSRKLNAVLGLLADVAVQRVEAGAEGQSERIRTARLITVLGWEGGRAGNAPGKKAPGLEEGGVPERWDRLAVAVEPLLRELRGAQTLLQELPPAVCALSPREFPHAIPLALWVQRQFAAHPGVPAQREVQALVCEAGLADEPRTGERMKADWQQLRDLGVVGRWRQVRSEDGQNELRIEPPGLAAGARPMARMALRASARMARRARIEGGSDWAVS